MKEFDVVSGSEVQSILALACQRRIKITAAARYQNRWVSYNSRMIEVAGGKLSIEAPPPSEETGYEQALLGVDSGLNFRLNSYRYFFAGTLAAQPGKASTDGPKLLTMDMPSKLERQERRTLDRVDVPAGVTVRAAIWVNVSRNPVWVGSMLNLSVGGYQMKTSGSALNFFEPGDLVVSELTFGPQDILSTETHFRYGSRDGSMSLLGMGFTSLNLDLNPEAQRNYQFILKKIEEFRKANGS